MVAKRPLSGSNVGDLPNATPASPEPFSQSFFGSFSHTLDDKGRVSLPHAFRNALTTAGADSVVITNFICDGARCLEGYAPQEWSKFEARLLEKSRFDAKMRKLENYYLARAAVCGIDQAGRINIPAYLRGYAGLQKEVVFTPTLNGFRVWDNRVWELIFQEAEAALLDNQDLFLNVDRKE